MKWKGLNEVLIFGKVKELEFYVNTQSCEVKCVNLSKYSKPPTFELFRYGISAEAKKLAYQDWLDSFPPSVDVIISS